MEHLIKQFELANLKLKPWGRNDDIFAMDLRDDTFFISEGESRVSVQCSDLKMGQLVLKVKEEERRFEVWVRREDRMAADRVLEERGTQIRVSRLTPGGSRSFLLGRDERGHPFVAQLNRSVSSVQQAHEALKPDELKGVQVKGKGKNYRRGRSDTQTYRQGEWMFVETSQEERDGLNEALIERKVPIGPFWSGETFRGRKVRQGRGNPHTADELLVVFASDRKRTLYVRGKVKHAEHATLEFNHWMRVLRNQEASARTAGMTWVD